MGRMQPRRAARKDETKDAIVKALREASDWSVTDIDFPFDILVGARGVDIKMDCKTNSVNIRKDGYARHEKGKTTEAQEKFVRDHKGTPVYFPSSPEEAVAIVWNIIGAGGT